MLGLALAAGCGSEGMLGAPPAVHPTDVGRAGDGALADQLELIRGTHRLPALAAVTFSPDGVVEMGVSGVRALGHTELVTADDEWHVGSLTKSMTATLAAILVEEGRLGWRTTVGDIFPDLPRRAEYDAVTLTDLLTNSSGMTGDATSAPSWGGLATSAQSLRAQRRQLTKEYLAMAPSSVRGTFSYSNAGYIVAGAMLEEVTGEAWEDLLTRLVFAPLDMKSAGFGPPSGAEPVAEPWGHAIADDGFGPTPPGPAADNPPAIGPAGTVHASLADLARYYRVHLGNGDAAGSGAAPLLSSASLAFLHQPAPGTFYACGWGVAERSWAGGVALQHDGSNNFWYADVWLAPSRGFGVLVVTNGGGLRASTATNDAATMLITRFTGEPPR